MINENRFKNLILDFLTEMIKNPQTAALSPVLVREGYSTDNMINLLVKRGILVKQSGILNESKSENVYSVPKNKFNEKLSKLYGALNEDEGGAAAMSAPSTSGGATTAAASNNDAPIMPLGQPIKRKIYMTSEQVELIRKKLQEEAVTTNTAGDYQYDVPFIFKRSDGKKDAAYIHRKKNGGIGCETRKWNKK